MKALTPIIFVGIVSLLFIPSPSDADDYDTIRAEAEKHYAEGSYALAHEAYKKADGLDLHPRDARWVDFRLADTMWRSKAASEDADNTILEKAKAELEVLVRDIKKLDDRDLVWAEVHESLGDYHWERRRSRNWGMAWNHYQHALDWWAGSDDLEVARGRYLGIVWTVARPQQARSRYYYGYYGNVLPLKILEGALKIAETEDDRARAHYLVAMTIRYHGGDWQQRVRVPEEFEAAIGLGKKTDWYDDALYHYAEWMASYGRAIPLEGGQWRQEPDYVKAVEIYRRILSEFRKGETRYYDSAKNQIANITRPVAGVSVNNFFTPGSEIQYYLGWRNVKRIDLAVYGVDLLDDISFAGTDVGSGSYLHRIDLGGREKVAEWTHETGDKGDHKPGQATMRLEKSLPTGAYIIEARGAEKPTRDLILVTDAAVVLKTSPTKALCYVSNIYDGSPLGEAEVTVWERYHDGDNWKWRDYSGKTDGEGLVTFELAGASKGRTSRDLYVAARQGDLQTFSLGSSYHSRRRYQPWRIYVFTDRPAYRPGESAKWKLMARTYDGQSYGTPANETILYEITDPRGSKVMEGKETLNLFGSASGSLDLTETMPLGEYRVRFFSEDKKQKMGGATIFRLEEYKLPEFEVSIGIPEEDGKKKAFRIGETVEVEIEAAYYFGGPVADATVQVMVYQKPFWHWYAPRRNYPWLYEDMRRPAWYHWGGHDQLMQQETHKTDGDGKLVFSFDTPRGASQDFQYRIEARVTDKSRREIVASESVKVTRQRYFVYMHPDHHIYRPQEKVKVDIKAMDANDQPMEVAGTVTVTREVHREVWIDPEGAEVEGGDLKKIRKESKIFPPPGWRLKVRGYEKEEIFKRGVKTDKEGKGELVFTPEREGYYRIAWSSPDPGAPHVITQTTVWVADKTSRDLGYWQGGVEIILDKDTFRAGRKAPVMISVPSNDRYVLFSVEGEDIYSHQLVHLDGTVKLLEMDIEEDHVPNIYLSALMVADRQLFQDTKQVVVPPDRHFLSVDLKFDEEAYQPGQKGKLTVITKDHEGKPISAEVAIGVVDESVYYIQEDYAGDPRQFYYGSKRPHSVNLQSTFHTRQFTKLALGEDEKLKEVADHGGPGDDAFGWGEGGGRGGAAPPGAPAEESEMAFDGAMERKMGAPRPAMRARAKGKKESLARSGEPADGEDPGAAPVVRVRSDFRSTVAWLPDIITDGDGRATVDLDFPDSLTGWRATARVQSKENHFGIHKAKTRTRQPLIVRLQAPRFFVVGDEVIISAVINNNTDDAMTVTPGMEAEGLKMISGASDPVSIPARGEKRVDWRVSALKSGAAKITVTGRGEKHADGMEKRFVVHDHGLEKLVTKSGKVRGKDVAITLNIPKERKPESTNMVVQVAPSIAVTMLDALPYLTNYPYGCTEQTMSRFLPTVITLKTMEDLGIDRESLVGKVFGGIEQEHVKKTHPDGKKDLEKMDEMIQQSLERLYDFQHSDGGWGWWKKGSSDHFMTAYVLWGLTLAHEAGVDVKRDVASRAASYLDKELVEEEDAPDMQAWMLHATSIYANKWDGKVGDFQMKAFDNLWKGRDQLNAYTRALFALAAHYQGDREKAETLVRNLRNGVKKDETPDTSIVQRGDQESHGAVMATAHWGEDGIWYRWSHGGVEATATALRAILAIDPDSDLVEPVVNWLVKGRRGAQWNSTRDTAMAVLALNDYLVTSGELKAGIEYELFVNGSSLAKKKVSPEEALAAPSRFPVKREWIKDGANEIRIVRSGGEGAIYFAAEVTFFSLEEPVTPAGNEIFVRRQYHKLVPRPTLLKGVVYHKEPLDDGQTVTSGTRIETVITIEAKNNYEYLVFEDLKPAGIEAVQIRSGEPVYTRQLKASAKIGQAKRDPSEYTGRSRWVYQELRDRKVALFVDKLPEGIWEIRYELRAEVPGKFHALPVKGYAMYVPEIRCNGAEVRLQVADTQEF